jgi:hypothetical protein
VLEEYDPTKIQDEYARDIMQKALNLLEKAFVQVDKLREENQKLRDELALLKGEQPKPRILPNRSSKKDDPISSEKERNSWVKKRPKAKRKATHAKLTIHQQQKLTLDRTTLPADAEFKGYRRVIVRDVIFGGFNTCFKKERYYSPSTQQTYEAELPPGYRGQFGPGLKALTYALYFAGNMSEDKIQELFAQGGVALGIGSISAWLCLKGTERDSPFYEEYQQVYQAGIASSPWQHLDTTITRVEGNNYNCHILTNPLYNFYCTLPQRDRLSALQALRGGATRVFRLDKNAAELSRLMGLSKHW